MFVPGPPVPIAGRLGIFWLIMWGRKQAFKVPDGFFMRHMVSGICNEMTCADLWRRFSAGHGAEMWSAALWSEIRNKDRGVASLPRFKSGI